MSKEDAGTFQWDCRTVRKHTLDAGTKWRARRRDNRAWFEVVGQSLEKLRAYSVAHLLFHCRMLGRKDEMRKEMGGVQAIKWMRFRVSVKVYIARDDD